MSHTFDSDVRGVVLDARVTFAADEFCRLCGIRRSMLVEMVDEGVVEPVHDAPEWHFDGVSVTRAQRALRLVEDLGVNWPGAALAIDLLERLERQSRRRLEPAA